jgi:transcriptional regulator GlxA family with amidase domain
MQRIGYIVTPGFTMMGLTIMGAFEVANQTVKERAYEAVILSEHGGLVQSSGGMSVESTAFDDTYFDSVIIGGSLGIDRPSPKLLEFLRRSMASSRRIASTCSGAYFLAAAGILDERRATTHWRHIARLRMQYPKVRVEGDCIYVIDGSVWTSAGMAAGFDLAFAMIESDLGSAAARSAARYMMVDHRRPRAQSQHSALLELNAKTDRIQAALAYAKRNLHTTLSIGRLAEAAHLSERQFCRRFVAETGQSPAKAIERLRVEAARVLVEGRLPLATVAGETGFADPERMRRAFIRAYGHSPQVMRRNAKGTVHALQQPQSIA